MKKQRRKTFQSGSGERISGEVKLEVNFHCGECIEATKAENIELTSRVKEFLSIDRLAIFTTPITVEDNVISMRHTGEDRVSPRTKTDLGHIEMVIKSSRE